MKDQARTQDTQTETSEEGSTKKLRLDRSKLKTLRTKTGLVTGDCSGGPIKYYHG
jgi:hypothetical protein